MPDVRTFRAPSMQQALEQVRLEMGFEAVILQAREVAKRRLFKRRFDVEVTAGLGMRTAAVDVELPPAPALSPTFASPQQASALMGRRTLAPRSDAGIDLTSEHGSASASPSVDGTAPTSAGRTGKRTSARGDSLAARLETIESLLVQFGQRVPQAPSDALPEALFPHYARLIEADVAHEHARSLILELQRRSGPDRPADPDHLQAQLAELIQSQFRCSGPIAVRSNERRIVALVGPTGVGKTTTIAKLAANFRLRDGVKLGLVTVDTYRVAAVEQLRTYADIIDLPMKVVTSPLEMRRAIDELADMDLVLIDTAGRSPREELQLQELKALLGEARVDEVHLVLSLASSPGVLEMTAQKFDPVGVTSLILTKLDEALGVGTLLGVARAIDQPLSYITAGQDVPDDIETADAARAMRLILGEDDLFLRRG